ncbi:hypothetical protein H3H36_24790 [Duganella sp. FT3S]|uniref:Uncharacterized protein n=1 Tax=Rugamonas fusca TaxID=2758568 RepID=A0A7W2EMC2_9BURK|nr:hypothetical protein [Rugamonas fusca]MBA5608565.1 hypothetical protein [Rugamonas fusca]
MKTIPLCLMFTTCFAVAHAGAADIVVHPELPDNVQPRFFERIRAPGLVRAIEQRGTRVTVRNGWYRIKVPCDGIEPSRFADLSFLFDEKAKPIQFFDCGAYVGDGHVTITR